MGASAILLPTSVRVDPGGEAVCQLTVRNTGTVVDEFTITVLGDSAPWAHPTPPKLSLFPGTEGQAEIRFTPPRSWTTAVGAIAFGVRVASHEDPKGSVVEEGTVDVGHFSDVSAELVPRTSRGRRSARHELAFDNRGNARVNAQLTAKDPDNLLVFDFDPPALMAEPNTAAFARVKVKPTRRFLRGPAKTHLFQVTVQSDGEPPVTAEGTLLQEPLTPRWLPMAALGAVGLVALWFGVFKPTVKAAARQAVAAPLAEQQQEIEALKAGRDPSPPDDDPAPEPAPTALETLGDPFDTRLAVGAAADSDRFTVEENRVFSLTDIVLQNPAGDAGTLEVRRNSAVILRVNLSNFRDLDYHFVSSVVFQPKQNLVLAVQCANPEGGPACTPAAYFAGFMKTPTAS